MPQLLDARTVACCIRMLESEPGANCFRQPLEGSEALAWRSRCTLFAMSATLRATPPCYSPPSPAKVDSMQREGYYSFVYKLDPQQFGFCVARPRFWIVCVALESTNSTPEAELHEIMRSSMDRYCAVACEEMPVALRNLLLPENHPSVVQQRGAAESLKHASCLVVGRRPPTAHAAQPC